jgi:hypothetical protein
MLLIKDLAAIKKRLSDLEKEEQGIRDRLMPILADSETVQYGGQLLLTYRNNKPSQKTDWKMLADYLMSDLDVYDGTKLIADYSQLTTGARVLRLAKNLESLT